MTLPLYATGILLAATFLLAVVGSAVLWLFRRRQRGYWRGVLWGHALLLPVHLFATFPLALGYVGSRWIGTRLDEQGYQGPRLLADGTIDLQSRKSLQQERTGELVIDPAVLAAARARAHRVDSSDGVVVRAFRIEPLREPPRAVVVLVHGLFRSAMELEPVAAMLRQQGCECWLLEQRNHGESSRAPFTAGLRESRDVVAVVQYVRAQPGRADVPLVLYGVSLGTVAVSLALPRLDGIAGVVLDAPIDDVASAAHRMLSRERGDGRPRPSLAEPWRSLTLTALGLWSGFDLTAVAPAEVLATLPHDLPMLVVGAGDDDRAPPESVERLFARLPMPPPFKELWIDPGSSHGQVFLDRPDAYAAALGRLLERLR